MGWGQRTTDADRWRFENVIIFWSQASKEEKVWGENPRGLYRGARLRMWGEISQTSLIGCICIVYCVLWYKWHHDLALWVECQITEGQMVWLSPPSWWPGWQTARPAWPRNRSTTTRWMWPFVKLSLFSIFDDTNYRWKGRYSWSITAQRSR